MANYWIFIATSHSDQGLTGNDIYGQRMSDRFWGLGERTPNRKALRPADKVVFYVGNPEMAFRGTATLKSFELTEAQRDQLSHGKPFYRPPYGVFLDDVEVWEKAHPVQDILMDLKFIENKVAWYSYFQGGVRQVSEEDFLLIAGSREIGVVEQLRYAKDVESQSEFFLENHLEEFIDRNWSSIDFHCNLVRYQAEEQGGRQFPAGRWSLDFLCVDNETNELVVIELKRGKTSDAAVGQILRYIAWVRENLAAPRQRVRGIIISHEADEALRYAVKATPDVGVLTYRVSFGLTPMG